MYILSLKSRQGFTLIELMITVAILGILGAVALAVYTPIRQKARCQQVTVGVHDSMVLLVEEVAENGTAPLEAGFSNTQTINGQVQTFPANIQISFSGNGTAVNPFIVNGQRVDFTCPDGDGIYSLGESQLEGAW